MFKSQSSEMHFSNLSISAPTVRTRLAVFGMLTLFLIACSLFDVRTIQRNDSSVKWKFEIFHLTDESDI